MTYSCGESWQLTNDQSWQLNHHQMTAIIMMLMYKNAVKAFMKGKNLTLGGGISVAAGPIGRLVVESELLGLMCESNAKVS